MRVWRWWLSRFVGVLDMALKVEQGFEVAGKTLGL